VLLEPAAAAGLAALAVHDLPGAHVATVLTGSNPREELLGELLAP
jgi:threonine dehydratase